MAPDLALDTLDLLPLLIMYLPNPRCPLYPQYVRVELDPEKVAN